MQNYIWMNIRLKQFSEKADNIIVDNNLENATEHDFCFVERQEVRIEAK